MTEIIDIHTHSVPRYSGRAIVNQIVGVGERYPHAHYVSAGIHPWHIIDDGVEQLRQLEEMLTDNKTIAIGETGIDHLCDTPIDIQRELFTTQADMAERRGLPLIIHAVKSQTEILESHSRLRPSVPWIIHGFRGKPEQARQYLSKGIYLSFGALYNTASLCHVYKSGTLLMESDESTNGIDDIYRRAGELLSITPEELKQCVRQNVERLFFDKSTVVSYRKE
jgi:TatD DNase family protein